MATLPSLTKRTGFQLLKHVVGPRAKFVPSVSHPTEVASYTSTYDAKASEACG